MTLPNSKVSINTRGFDRRKENFIFVYIRNSAVDFCLIQETLISDPSDLRSLSSRWRGPCFWSPSVGRQGGVLILISEVFEGNVLSWRKDTAVRVVSLLLEFDRFKVNLIDIYAPTTLTDRKAFFENLHDFFIPADARIIAGDFNCYEHQLDKFGGNFSPAVYLSDFRASFNFTDAWRKFHPRACECTWFNSDLSIGSRLDKFFVSRNIVSAVLSCEVSPFCFSDHDFVVLSFQFDDNLARGPGLWKFNNSLLHDNDFCAFVSSRIEDLSDSIDAFPSVKAWWDFFKNSIKSDIIFFSRQKRRRLSHERVMLTNRIISLKRRLVSGDVSVCFEIESLVSRLKVLTLKELEGSKIRSRVQWLEEGEKPSRFFFRLEREHFERNSITSVLNSDDVEVFSRAEIERVHVQFYSRLFSNDPIDDFCKQLCLNSLESSLSGEHRVSYEGPLSLLELTNSVKSLNLGRSPGSDGLSVEFYLRFWDCLGPLLHRVANQCFLDGELCDSMKGSVTRVIFKKRGDIKNLKNWRPISMLNVDYKIISKVITTRLSNVLEFIVNPDQICSVPGRSYLFKCHSFTGCHGLH